MSPEKLYLICFLVGFLLSLLAVVMHSVDFHMPGQQAHLPAGHTSGAHGHGHGFSKFNFTTFSAFLAWFGGTGYLLERYSTFGLALALVLAIVSGIIGATIVFVFVAKVLLRNERDLDPADFDMIGVLGKVSSGVREQGGIGEMIYSQNSTRRAVPIRAEDGAEAIPRDTEVVVTRYERGVAYVRRWDELSGLND
jgi:membrane protein implicated in regulation of membrane protease activity